MTKGQKGDKVEHGDAPSSGFTFYRRHDILVHLKSSSASKASVAQRLSMRTWMDAHATTHTHKIDESGTERLG